VPPLHEIQQAAPRPPPPSLSPTTAAPPLPRSTLWRPGSGEVGAGMLGGETRPDPGTRFPEVSSLRPDSPPPLWPPPHGTRWASPPAPTSGLGWQDSTPVLKSGQGRRASTPTTMTPGDGVAAGPATWGRCITRSQGRRRRAQDPAAALRHPAASTLWMLRRGGGQRAADPACVFCFVCRVLFLFAVRRP
jgi:hypothetical protein